MRTIAHWVFIGLAAAGSRAGADELTDKEMGTARSLYVGKCAKCHQFYEPTNYPEGVWRVWMEKMIKKSKLKSEPADLLMRYLGAYRAGQLAGKPEGKRGGRSGLR